MLMPEEIGKNLLLQLLDILDDKFITIPGEVVTVF
jgi:hypothetical protein